MKTTKQPLNQLDQLAAIDWHWVGLIMGVVYFALLGVSVALTIKAGVFIYKTGVKAVKYVLDRGVS